jgi:hypothetical protein
LNAVTVQTNEEFLEIVTAFYAHMYRHTARIHGTIEKTRLGAEALDVLKKTFKGDKGYNEALSEARTGTRGGLRYVLDRMTEYLKAEAREKHVLKTLKENIDPLDYAARVEVISALLRLLHGHLPDEITAQPPERFADDYEEIIKAYVHSTAALKTTLRRL